MTLRGAGCPFTRACSASAFFGGSAARKKAARKLAPPFVTTRMSCSMQREQLPKIAHSLFFLVGLAEVRVDAELLGPVAMLFGGARGDHDNRNTRKVDVCLDGL